MKAFSMQLIPNPIDATKANNLALLGVERDAMFSTPFKH